jgi:uncharacterized protein (DUF2267 family)
MKITRNHLQAKTAVNNTGQAAAVLDALLPSILDRAWTHSRPTQSGCAFHSAKFVSRVPNALGSKENCKIHLQ